MGGKDLSDQKKPMEAIESRWNGGTGFFVGGFVDLTLCNAHHSFDFLLYPEEKLTLLKFREGCERIRV